MNETLGFLSEGNATAWSEVRKLLQQSDGALHIRSVFREPYCKTPAMCTWAQQTLATRTKQLNLQLSVENGEGALCGAGSGEAKAKKDLLGLTTFLASGGRITFFEITSTFSRTTRGCQSQSLNETVREVTAYAVAMAVAVKPEKIFLYDALPHYSVGDKWPANVKGYNLELGNVLTLLQSAMAKKGLSLAGYWMDCPYEYSDQYPYGDGFKKIAAAVKLVKGMGLLVGKTFNSQSGGNGPPGTGSNEGFYNKTMNDYTRTAAVVPSGISGGHSLDFIMVESWYKHPSVILPEQQPYTLTYTAEAVLRQAS